MFIWRSLLKLPENHAAYSSLVDKGTHNAFARLHEEYPIKSRKLLRVLQRLVIGCNYGRIVLCCRVLAKLIMKKGIIFKLSAIKNESCSIHPE